MAEEVRERRDAADRQAAADAADLAELHGKEDAVARRRLQLAEERIRTLEARVVVLERELRSQHLHPTRVMLASDQTPGEEEDGRRSRLVWIVCIASILLLLILLLGLVFLGPWGRSLDRSVGGAPRPSASKAILGATPAAIGTDETEVGSRPTNEMTPDGPCKEPMASSVAGC
jgi:hypothetical protein